MNYSVCHESLLYCKRMLVQAYRAAKCQALSRYGIVYPRVYVSLVEQRIVTR